jgi:hypothetical protein
MIALRNILFGWASIVLFTTPPNLVMASSATPERLLIIDY